MASQSPADPASDDLVPFREGVRTWIRVGLLSFGGPAGQIAVMHRILVEEKRWLSEQQFLRALNYCMLLPGPEAQQLAIYSGWVLHGYRGGLVAGWFFVVPGFLAILVLSILYAVYQDVTFVSGLFFGLKAAVLAIVVEAVVRIGRRALRRRVSYLIAAAAFVAIFFLTLPFPVIIAGAAVAGLSGARWAPRLFGAQSASDSDEGGQGSKQPTAAPTIARAVRVILVWGTLWLLPTAILMVTTGPTSVWATEARFFSQAAVVTFGGAYAVLAYVAQQAVEVHGWLQPGEMLDGLSMAETTPGPLIQVVQFVGFMGAYRNSGSLDPLLAAVLASILVTWVTFTPCFLWIFLGAPYVERLRGATALNTALSCITAAVVGVILNLAIWFSLHVLFRTVDEYHVAGMRFLQPNLTTVEPAALAIAVAALVAVFRFHFGMLTVLGGAGLAGVVYGLIVGL
ncbi:MAG: chromate efflux transporter [Chloroflexi bacterium]|nr:chromate efflux transporter [Chloroflexota bacterium]